MSPLYPADFDPNGPIDVEAIAAEMRPALYRWFNAHILIVDPKTAEPGQPYDPHADTGGASTMTPLVDSGAGGALIQSIRAPRTVQQSDQAAALLGIRFQMKMEVLEGVKLHSGLQILVVDGGNDPELAQFTYALKKPLDSSLAWGKILEATVVAGGRA